MTELARAHSRGGAGPTFHPLTKCVALPRSLSGTFGVIIGVIMRLQGPFGGSGDPLAVSEAI